MDFYEQLKLMSDEEIKSYLDELIPELEKESKKVNHDTFGFKISYNQDKSKLIYDSNMSAYKIELNYVYSGYMPLNTKVVYGIHTVSDGTITNRGMYYTVDDDNYIYAFCKYIKNVDVVNENNLFDHISIFLNSYYGKIKKVDRDTMFKLLLKDNNTYFEPTKEHKLSDFKGKGNALCSEYAVMANNILNVFDIYSNVFLGQLRRYDNTEGHVFNIVEYTDRETGEDISAIVDFAVSVDVFDINYKKVGVSPYVLYIKGIEMMTKDYYLDGYEYNYVAFPGYWMKIPAYGKREYFTCNNIVINDYQKQK